MPVPKRKTSTGRRNKRRSHLSIKGVELKTCISCKNKIRPHTTCTNCDTYNK